MKKNLGRKKSRSYAMKGGAAGPYVYEGVPLTLDNPYTHFAVNSNDDGSYNFNIPEKKTGGFFSKTTPAVNFTRFCELYQYYQANSPISCIQQQFLGKDGTTRYKAPSFVDILGFILLLMGTEPNTAGGMNLHEDKFFKTSCNLLLLVMNRGPICEDQAGTLLMSYKLREEILLKQIQKFLPSFTIDQMTTLPITSLGKSQIDRLLEMFKKVLFFYRYNALPSAGYLTFERMSSTEQASRAFGPGETVDSVNFKTEKDKSYFRNNEKLYRDYALSAALSGSQAGPAPLGGRGRTRVKRTNKNRRMRTRRSRTRRTTRKY